MKKIYSFILATFIAASGYAQIYCGGARYDSQVFSNFTKKADVMYGKNNKYTGAGKRYCN